MKLIDKSVIDKGLRLEALRREAPLDESGYSTLYDIRNKEYIEFLTRYGWLLLKEREEV